MAGGEREREMKVEEAFDEGAKKSEKDEGQQRWGGHAEMNTCFFTQAVRVMEGRQESLTK